MNYKGIIIEESLKDAKVLKKISIIETKIEQVTQHHQTPWLNKWTLHTIEIPQEKADGIAEEISEVINETPSAWYADFKNNLFHYIIYPHKVFKVDLKNPKLYVDAKKYGISLGIPSYQVDFAPDDKIWDR